MTDLKVAQLQALMQSEEPSPGQLIPGATLDMQKHLSAVKVCRPTIPAAPWMPKSQLIPVQSLLLER